MQIIGECEKTRNDFELRKRGNNKKISGKCIRGDVKLTAVNTENSHFSDVLGNKDKKDGKQESGRTVLSPDRNRENGLQGICFPPLKNINDVILIFLACL